MCMGHFSTTKGKGKNPILWFQIDFLIFYIDVAFHVFAW
jgi:hypothetical protein